MRLRDRTMTKYLLEGRYNICPHKTSNVCSQYKNGLKEGKIQECLCHTKIIRNYVIDNIKHIHHCLKEGKNSGMFVSH